MNIDAYDKRHGGPFDRGAADSYYRRGFSPHYFVGDTYMSPRVDEAQMTSEEIIAYKRGYDYNEAMQSFKEWD